MTEIVPDHRDVIDLPVQLASVVGRGVEPVEVVELLQAQRLVTLAVAGHT